MTVARTLSLRLVSTDWSEGCFSTDARLTRYATLASSSIVSTLTVVDRSRTEVKDAAPGADAASILYLRPGRDCLTPGTPTVLAATPPLSTTVLATSSFTAY